MVLIDGSGFVHSIDVPLLHSHQLIVEVHLELLIVHLQPGWLSSGQRNSIRLIKLGICNKCCLINGGSRMNR